MPRIVNTDAPRRLPAPPTLHLQAPSDHPAPRFCPDVPGDDLVYFDGLSDTRQLWDPQPPFPGQDFTRANEFAQNSDFYGLQRYNTANATNWGHHEPMKYSPSMRDTLRVLGDTGCSLQYDGSVGYGMHVSSTSPYTASSQLSETERSDSSSPVGFVAGQPLLWRALNNLANKTQQGYSPLPSIPRPPPHVRAQIQEHFETSYDAPQPVARAIDQPLPLAPPSSDNLGECVMLSMLRDPPSPSEKPDYPYPTLIRAAILGSPRNALTLQGIYDALESRFDWFRMNRNEKGWKNSIRHNLSLNKLFRRLEKPASEPGKGCYWTVDFAAGEGNKRERRRTKRAGLAEKTRRAQAAAADEAKAREAVARGSSKNDALAPAQGHNGSASSFNGQRVYADGMGIDLALLQARAVPRTHPAAHPSRDVFLDGAASYPGQHTRPWPIPYMPPPSTQGPPTWGTAPSGPQAFGYLFPLGSRAYGAPQFHAHNISGPPSSSQD